MPDTLVLSHHSHADFRWYTSSDCDQSLSYACQSSTDPNDWLVSESTGPYDVTRDLCPIGYKFSLPHNGFRQQKVSGLHIFEWRGVDLRLCYPEWDLKKKYTREGRK